MGLTGLRLVMRLRRRRPAPHIRPDGDRRRRKPEIQIRLAQSADELEAAYRLVQAQYARRGYAKGGAEARFVTHCCIPSTHTLIATVNNVVVGTASLIVDSPLGLPLESTYPEQVCDLRAAGETLAEISCLATRRRGDTPVLLGLYRGIYALARHRDQVDRLCITVHPRQRRFYQRALLFDMLGPERDYAACNQAPAVALGLDLRTAEGRFRRMHGWGWLSRFFLGRGDLATLARGLDSPQASRSRLTFAQRQPGWRQLDETVRTEILARYNEL